MHFNVVYCPLLVHLLCLQMFVCTALLFLILYESKHPQSDVTVMKIVCVHAQHVLCLIVLPCIGVIFYFLTVFASIIDASTTQLSFSPSKLSQMGKSVAPIVSACVYKCMSMCMFLFKCTTSHSCIYIYKYMWPCVSV